MSEKTEKSTHKKKIDKVTDGRKYAVISSQSVISLAETCGISELREDVASKIGEDATYRLREIIQGCSVLMRNSNDRILKSSDVAKILPRSNEMHIYGYMSGGSSEFLHVPEAGVYVSDNAAKVNLPLLALSNSSFSQKGNAFVRGMWCLAEGATYRAPIIGLTGASSSSEPISISVESHLNSYFLNVSKIILCKDDELLHFVLQDLRTNSKITPVVPYFINLLVQGLQELVRGSDACENLLRMLHSLTLNSHVYRDASVIVSGLITALLTYAVDPLPFEATSVTRDLELRGVAAEAISKVLMHWYGSDECMLKSILRKMQAILINPSSSLRSHHGALLVLTFLGNHVLASALEPLIEEYIEFLVKLPYNQETIELGSCFLRAVSILCHNSFRDNASQKKFSSDKLASIYKLLYFHFGDVLCAQWQFVVTSSNKPTNWNRNAGVHFLDFSVDVSETNKGSNSVNDSKNVDFKTSVKHKGTFSEMFDASLMTKKSLSLKSNSGISLWSKKLKRNKFAVGHRQYSGPSSYYLKCAKLKHVGRMPHCRLHSSDMNFACLFSSCL